MALVKRCPQCGIEKSHEDFPRDTRRKDGLNPWCRVCRNAKRRAWRARLSPEERRRPPGSHRSEYLKRVYGISQEQYGALLAEQNGVCAICSNGSSNGWSLSVDHDHECCPGKKSCGKCVRGLLCVPCNTLLGMVGDDPKRLLGAADYLERV